MNESAEVTDSSCVRSSGKIILCDSQDADRAGVAMLLAGAGYFVTAVGSYAELLPVFTETNPDLLILDLHLSDRDGFWVAEQLGLQQPSIPVIFLSGIDRPIYRTYAPFAVQHSQYLLKPVPANVLLKSVCNLIRLRGVPVSSGNGSHSLGQNGES